MTAPRILGVDPGVTGGLAFLHSDEIEAHDVPVAAGELNIDEILRLIRDAKPTMAVIESASSRPGQGVSSVFKFGAAYGALQTCAIACWVPLHRVTPSVWKRHFKLSADKEQARALAIRLWPGVGLFTRKRDHGRAEAALIARYGLEVLCRRT